MKKFKFKYCYKNHHYALIINEDEKTYSYLTITHAKYYGKKNNFKFLINPNIKDSRNAYFIKKIYIRDKNDFSKWYFTNLNLSAEDQKRVEEFIKNKMTKKEEKLNKELIWDEVKSKINIINLIEEFIPLQKKGANFVACCPFHSEKTPSFVVNNKKQIYKCFGCNNAGDVYSFLTKIKNLNNKYEALEILAKKANIDVSEYLKFNNDADFNKYKDFFNVNEEANTFFQYHMLTKKNGNTILANFIENRKLNKELIKEFEIGFAPKDISINDYLESKESINLTNLEEMSLVSQKDSKLNFFNERITFPIKDEKGRIVGFSARDITNQNDIKYLNSAENKIFNKSKTLFNYYHATPDINQENKVYVVEGQFDCIAMHQIGIKNTVALMGTALTKDHLRLLKNKTITLFLDNDTAGQKATLKSINIILQNINEFNLKLNIISNIKSENKSFIYKDVDELKIKYFENNDKSLYELIKNNEKSIYEFLEKNYFYADIYQKMSMQEQIEHFEEAFSIINMLPISQNLLFKDNIIKNNIIQKETYEAFENNAKSKKFTINKYKIEQPKFDINFENKINKGEQMKEIKTNNQTKKTWTDEEKAEYREKQSKLIDAIIDEANNELETFLRDPKKMQKFLDFTSQIKNKYSFSNMCLIMRQFEGATIIKSFTDWSLRNVSIKSGEKGLKILAPVIQKFAKIVDDKGNEKDIPIWEWTEKIKEKVAKDEIKTIEKMASVKICAVFDISQTTLKKEEYPKNYFTYFIEEDETNRDKNLELFNKIKDAIYKKGITIEESASLGQIKGCSSIQNKTIWLNEHNSIKQNVKTLLHEYAHIKLNHSYQSLARSECEFQAELVAYTCAKQLGIDTKLDSFDYIKSWCNETNSNEKRHLLDEVIYTSKNIIYEFENFLKEEDENELTKKQDKKLYL